MHSFYIIICLALNLCFFPLSNCFFIRNPLTWFNFGGSNVSQNEDVIPEENDSSIESPDSVTTPNPLLLNPVPNQQSGQQINIVFPERSAQHFRAPQSVDQTQPLSLSRLGVPLKTNRFGLQPLPYPARQTNFPLRPQNPNWDLNRRFGDVKQNSNIYSTERPDRKVSPPANLFSTAQSISETTVNNVMEKNVTKSNKNEYQVSEELLEENEENISPMPVYIASSTVANNIIPTQTTTTKPLYLHRPDFAAQLNEMYYNRPDIFQPMMDKLKPKQI